MLDDDRVLFLLRCASLGESSRSYVEFDEDVADGRFCEPSLESALGVRGGVFFVEELSASLIEINKEFRDDRTEREKTSDGEFVVVFEVQDSMGFKTGAARPKEFIVIICSG